MTDFVCVPYDSRLAIIKRMNLSSIPSVGELRTAGKPALLRQAGAEAAAATRAAFEVRAHNTFATFRIHPFPEGEGNLRRSVREAECVYLQSTLEDFLRYSFFLCAMC